MSSTIAGYPATPLTPSALPLDSSLTTELGLFTNEATKAHALGRRCITWDGSVYRYSLAAAALASTQMGVHTTATGAVAYEVIAAAAAIGDTTLSINEAGITKNQYAGGYVVIFETGSSGGFVRGVISNTASDASNGVILTLDSPLHVALTTADAYELYASPYAALSQANTSGEYAFLGVPGTTVTSGYYFWTKTWGPIFLAPQSGVGASYVKTGYFRHDGSIDVRANIGTNVSDQIAGFCMVGSASGNGPLFMLQVSI
jgi:hypothetical protein